MTAPAVARPGWLPPLLLLTATVLAYANTLNSPFLFDDPPSIEKNETIRSLWPLSPVLQPPSAGGPGVAGRPVVNLTLALNYAAGGLDPRGYHAFNLALHGLAALSLFGLVRRLVAGPVLGARVGHLAVPFASAVALLWAVHPLQTESVTCVIQRTELLVGLFYLLTLYCLVRAAASSGRAAAGWQVAGLAAALLGMASKEVMVTAPIVAFLLDRTFLAGSFAGAWRARRWFHCGLAATWLLLLHLLAGNPMRGGTAGYDGAISVWQYLLTQCHAVVLYLRLTVWPHPLVLDYGSFVVGGLGEVWPQAVALVALLAAAAVALRRRPVVGFCLAAFFLVLAPSSSFVPLLTQTIAEHRMYLPLAAVIAAALAPLLRLGATALVAVAAPLALVLLIVTVDRNRDYRTAEGLWLDNLAKRPANVRSYVNLAELADRRGDFAAAVEYSRQALALNPRETNARFCHALNLVRLGRAAEALPQFERALQDEPAAPDLRINYGAALLSAGRVAEAVQQFQRVLAMGRRGAEDHFNLAQAQLKAGNLSEALTGLEESIRLNPAAAEPHYQYAGALVRANRLPEAVTAYRTSLRLQPDRLEAWINLGSALYLLGRPAEAVAAYEEALRLAPGDARARERLAAVRASLDAVNR